MALDQVSSSGLRYSTHCWRSKVVHKMNTRVFESRRMLELVVSSQSFSEIGCLTAHEQIVLIHDFSLGQEAILMEGEQDA